jgi:hypothetical protein
VAAVGDLVGGRLLRELLKGLADLVAELLALEEMFAWILFAAAMMFILGYAVYLAWN